MVLKFLLPIAAISSLLAGDIQRFPIGARKDMSGMGFVDQNKKKCIISDFKGKVVLIDFWVMWCGPCVKSIPEVHQLQRLGTEKGTLVVIPCNLDDELWPQNVYKFIKKNEKALDGFLYYRTLGGKQGINTNLGEDIKSYPTSLILDKSGKLAVRWSGYGNGIAAHEINQLINEIE